MERGDFAVEIIDEPPPPEDDCSVTREVLAALLTQDDNLRRDPAAATLRTFADMRDLQGRLQAAPVETWAVVPTPHFRARRRRAADGTLSKEQQVRRRLLERFPLLDELLEIGRGRMVVGGPAVALAILEDLSLAGHCHADFFLHNVERDEEADELLARLVRFLVAASGAAETPRARVVLTRTRGMLQVSLCSGSHDAQWGDPDATHYRFRLRLHRSVQEIVLAAEAAPSGVALGCSGAIVMSPLAAFCLATRSLVADPSVRRSSLYEWHLQAHLERGFCVLLPSLKEELSMGREHNVVRTGQGGRTRGAVLQLGGGIILVGREDDRDNHRHNFGHVAKRLLIVGDLAANHSFRGYDMLASYGYLNIHHVCQGSVGLVMLTGDSLEDLLERPSAFGLDKIDEVFAERDVSLSRIRLMFGEDAVAYAEAYLRKDPDIDAIVARAKARVREWLIGAQQPGLQWERTHGWGHVPDTMPARQWYPRDLYEPTLSGLPPRFAPVFRQLRLRHAGFAALPRDVMRLLMRCYIVPAVADDIIEQWLARSRPSGLSETVSCSESETITSEGD